MSAAGEREQAGSAPSLAIWLAAFGGMAALGAGVIMWAVEGPELFLKAAFDMLMTCF